MSVRVACVMGTYGRYTLACEALACFLEQTAIEDAVLLIYNQHPVPLVFDHPRVIVVNERRHIKGLRHIRKRMIDLVDPSIEFIHWWDDDDLYLPWHLGDCFERIGDAVAWRPAASWMSERNAVFSKSSNRFEGSWIMRADALRRVGMDVEPQYSDHPFQIHAEKAGLLAQSDLGDLMSYIYRWDTGTQHLSGYATGPADTQANTIASSRAKSIDVQNEGRMIAPDLWPRWQQFLDGIVDKVAPESLDEIQARLSLAQATSQLSR